MTEFKMTKAALCKFGVYMGEAQLPKNIRQLEIRPEAVAEILQRTTDFRGKVFYEFRGLQQTLRGDRVPGAVRRSGGQALRQRFQLICDHLPKLLLLRRGTANDITDLLMKCCQQLLPLTRRLRVNDIRAIIHDRGHRSVERPAADILLDVRGFSKR